MDARVNVDESWGDVDACPRAPGEDFIVWWSNVIKHITVFRGQKSATLMLCPVPHHLRAEFKNPSAIMMLLRSYWCWKPSSVGLLSLFTSELKEESCNLRV